MRTTVIAVAYAAALTGCSATESKEAAEVAAKRFHAELNAGLTQDMWAMCGDELKAALGRDGFDQIVTGVRSRLGAFQSGQVTAWNVNYGTGGQIVTLRYDSAYEHGQAQENFVYRMEDGQPKLQAYAVNSPAFLIDQPTIR